MAEPPVKPKARFQFELRHLIYATVLLATSLGLFGVWGIVATFFLLLFWWDVLTKQRKSVLNAAKATTDEGTRESPFGLAFTLRELLVVVAIIGALLALLILSVRGQMARDGCRDNLWHLSTGLREYCQKHGTMPPVYVADDAGKPAHSWRVLILPELGRQDLYDQYRFDEPWDSPNNRKLLDETPWEYQCRDRVSFFGEHQPPEPGMTTYLAVTGKGAVWPDATIETLKELTASGDRTALIIDAEFQPVPWTKPEDFSMEDVSRLVDAPASVDQGHWRRGFLWSTYRGRRVIWANDHVDFLPPCEAPLLEEWLTVDGDTSSKAPERVVAMPPPDWRRLHYTNIARLVMFLLAAAWPIVWIVRERASKEAPSS